jgi:capsule polysaccharide export protein KpsE/RkpR
LDKSRYDREGRHRGAVAMKSIQNSTQEFARDLDLEELIANRLHHDRQESRGRRIARLARLWEKRKVLGKFVLRGVIVAVILALIIPPRYASTTRLMPPDSMQGEGLAMLATIAGKVSGSLGSLGSDLLGMKTSGELFAGVLQSRTVQDDLVTKFNLKKVYGARTWYTARKELGANTDVSIDRKSGILIVRVTDRDPKRAQAMAEEYVSELNNLVNQLNTSSAHRERVFLEQRLGEVREDLESAEKNFSQFASKTGAIDIKEQGKTMMEATAILEGQLIASQTELQGLRQIFSDQNIRVRAMQGRIDELRRQIDKLGGRAEVEGTATGNSTEFYPSIRKLPLLGVPYADLYRRMRVEEAIFETLTHQYELAKVQEAKEFPSIKVLDSPELPERKVFPPRTLIVLLGAIFSLALGMTWVLATDRWEQTDSQDPGKLLMLSVAQSVRSPLDYMAERRSALASRAKNIFNGSRNGSGPEAGQEETGFAAGRDYPK